MLYLTGIIEPERYADAILKSPLEEGDAHEHNGSAYFTFSSFCGFDLHR